MPKGKEGRLCFTGWSLPGPWSCCQLLNHLETAGRLPWPRPGSRAGRGQARQRPGQALGGTGHQVLNHRLATDDPPPPVPGPLAGWRVMSPSCWKPSGGSPLPTRQNPHAPAWHGSPSDSGLRLPLQPHAHLFVDYSHGMCLAIFRKCQALITLRFFTDCSFLGKALLSWQNPTLTPNSGTRAQ